MEKEDKEEELVSEEAQAEEPVEAAEAEEEVSEEKADEELEEILAEEEPAEEAAEAEEEAAPAHRLRQSPHPVELLMQVHDSIVFQTPLAFDVKRLNPFLTVPIPFDPPLCLKMKVKSSHKSWGDCE